MTTVTRWVPTWAKPYDQYGLPAVQTWEKSVGTPDQVGTPLPEAADSVQIAKAQQEQDRITELARQVALGDQRLLMTQTQAGCAARAETSPLRSARTARSIAFRPGPYAVAAKAQAAVLGRVARSSCSGSERSSTAFNSLLLWRSRLQL